MSESSKMNEKKPSRLMMALRERWQKVEHWLLEGSEPVSTHQPDDLKADAQ